jgi:ABC-type transporter Mla subunit MlaD
MIDRLNTAQQALDRIRDQARRTAEQLEKATDIAAQRSERVEQLREQLARAEREADKAADDRDRLQHQAEELRKAQDSAEDAVSDALSRLAGS